MLSTSAAIITETLNMLMYRVHTVVFVCYSVLLSVNLIDTVVACKVCIMMIFGYTNFSSINKYIIEYLEVTIIVQVICFTTGMILKRLHLSSFPAIVVG
jgi:hypothetical protein